MLGRPKAEPSIHDFFLPMARKLWMPASRAGMTVEGNGAALAESLAVMAGLDPAIQLSAAP
jgi:hypothetical protein